MTIFVTTPFEAEIPRFSDQSQRNSSFFVILASKKAKKNEFSDPKIGPADDKNALKTPF